MEKIAKTLYGENILKAEDTVLGNIIAIIANTLGSIIVLTVGTMVIKNIIMM